VVLGGEIGAFFETVFDCEEYNNNNNNNNTRAFLCDLSTKWRLKFGEMLRSASETQSVLFLRRLALLLLEREEGPSHHLLTSTGEYMFVYRGAAWHPLFFSPQQ